MTVAGGGSTGGGTSGGFETRSRLMAAFGGMELPADVADAIGRGAYAGVSLFRQHNVESLEQLRGLNAAIQAAAPLDARPLLIATDQETGQLTAVAHGTTEFAGAMALGATGDVVLAERVARATALELRAVGVNVNYAPVCDLADVPANPAMGIRAFGDDPQAVAEMAAATVRGLQAEGVAATAKHFPGLGGATADTHHELAAVPGDEERFERTELIPFRAAIAAGARLVMAAHVAVPGLTGDDTLPASLAEPVLRGMLRNRLGFTGVTITDALDMHALAQGTGQIVDVIAALRAGEDLLLATADAELVARAAQAISQAERRRLLDPADGREVAARLRDLRGWLSGFEEVPLDVVGCAEHRELARELAERSLTLVRNEDGLLPLRLPAGARIATVQPRPDDLTPADTSSTLSPALGAAVRRMWPATDDYVVEPDPTEGEISALVARLGGYDAIVLGTDAAHLRPGQAALARAVLATGKPVISVALRTPWDLTHYAEARTHVCTYSFTQPSMDALARALFGETAMPGRLPVALGELHTRLHGLAQWH